MSWRAGLQDSECRFGVCETIYIILEQARQFSEESYVCLYCIICPWMATISDTQGIHWTDCDSFGRLQILVDTLLELFPQCIDQVKKSKDGFYKVSLRFPPDFNFI
jgi:hypothetical protein